MTEDQINELKMKVKERFWWVEEIADTDEIVDFVLEQIK